MERFLIGFLIAFPPELLTCRRVETKEKSLIAIVSREKDSAIYNDG
jgi:hypothetical protein